MQPLQHTPAVWRCSPLRLCALRVQPRPCSTLGDIKAFMDAIRQRHQLVGGTLQLRVTEDLRVLAEHHVSSAAGESATAVSLDSAWQGCPTSTIRETLQALQSTTPVLSSAEGATTDPTAAPSSVSRTPAAMPPSTTAPEFATVVDLSRSATEEYTRVTQHLAQLHPSVKLRIRHTSGQDLQGTKLRTITVDLVPRASRMGAADALSAEDRRLLHTFKGESVGEGYSGCLCRALRDAFAGAALPYPSDTASAASAASVLSLYAQSYADGGCGLFLSPCTPPLTDQLLCSVRHQASGQTVDTMPLSLTATGLRELLEFCDRVAAQCSPERHASLTRRLNAAPLHLVLPRKGLRVKELLRKLLFYYYGIAAEDVCFVSHVKPGGVFATEVVVSIPPYLVTYDGASTAAAPPLFHLAYAAGTSKKRTMELAAVQAMLVLFPDIFAQQIAYHAEVREIQLSSRAALATDVAPHVSRGLEAQLKWALQTRKLDFEVESVVLQRNTAYPLWGVLTSTSSTWLTQLFLVQPTGEGHSSPQATQQSSPSPSESSGAKGSDATAPRTLCTHAFDSRKSRSEQKAMAAALAKEFPDLCKASIEDAKVRLLLDNAGKPAPFEGVQLLKEAYSAVFADALASDPCLATLAPTRSSVLQPLPDDVSGSTSASVLEQLWLAIAGEASDPLIVRVQRSRTVAANTSSKGYIAQCLTSTIEDAEVHDAPQQLLCEVSSSSEIGALFDLLAALRKVTRRTSDATTEGAGAAEESTTSGMAAFVKTVPRALPNANPLQTCAEAVARLYGMRCSVRISQDGVQYEAELWGTLPVDSALLQRQPRIPSSPFALDRTFLLGRGHAESPFMAVVRAAQCVFESHIRVHQRAFHDAIVPAGTVHLNPIAQSSLGQLRDAVLTEIKATSEQSITSSSLAVRFEHGQLYELRFRVSSGQQSVTLEEAVSRSLFDCMREFCKRVSTETGVTPLAHSKLAKLTFHTPEQLLQLLCMYVFGFALRTETCLVHQEWHCRLSIPVTGELASCVAEATASRKKDAIDAASAAALQRYFAEELPHMTAHASLAASLSVSVASVQMDSYMFRVSTDLPEDSSVPA